MAESRWTIPVKELTDKIGGDVSDLIRSIAMETFTRVILRTPVDRGRLRANWVASQGQPRVRVIVRDDKDGDVTIEAMKKQVATYPVGGIIWLANSLPYAATIEHGLYPDPPKRGTRTRGGTYEIRSAGGYSKQAPQGMVAITASEINGIIAEELAKAK